MEESSSNSILADEPALDTSGFQDLDGQQTDSHSVLGDLPDLSFPPMENNNSNAASPVLPAGWSPSPEALIGCSLHIRDGLGGMTLDKPVPIGTCAMCNQAHYSARNIEACFFSHIRPFKCLDGQCLERFQSHEAMLRHVEQVHRDAGTRQLRMYCKQCGDLMCDLQQVEDHQKRHLRELQCHDVYFECPYCKLQTVDPEYYLDHMQCHQVVSFQTLHVPPNVPDHALTPQMSLMRVQQQQEQHQRTLAVAQTHLKTVGGRAVKKDTAALQVIRAEQSVVPMSDGVEEEEPQTPTRSPELGEGEEQQQRQEEEEGDDGSPKKRKRCEEPQQILCTACLKKYSRPAWATTHAEKCTLVAAQSTGLPHQILRFENMDEMQKFRRALNKAKKNEDEIYRLLKALPAKWELDITTKPVKKKPATKKTEGQQDPHDSESLV